MSNVFKNIFGLEISNTSLTAVELAHSKTEIRVAHFSTIQLEPGIIEDDCIIVNTEAFKKALRKVLFDAKNGPITSKNLIISIPEEKTFSHHIDIPKEHIKDEVYIKNYAKDFIPIELDDAIVDFKPLKNDSNKEIATFNFVAIQKNIVKSLIKTLNDEGLNVVGVDVSNNSLMRYCNNRFQTNESGFMIVDIELNKSTISITTPSGYSYNINIKIGGQEFDGKLKQILNVSDTEELHGLISKLKQDENLIKPEDQNSIKVKLKDEFKSILQKVKELIKAISTQEDIELGTIYLIGCHSYVPGLKEAFSESFPGINIKQDLDYIKLDKTTELFYLKAIGLAIRGVFLEEYENEINLLPAKKKEEIAITQFSPTVIKYSLIVYLAVIILMLFAGISITESYLEYQITKQEATLYEEQAGNPYLKQVAQASQQKIELENQINTILDDAIPVSSVMKKIDDYNLEEINLVNVIYNFSKSGNHNIRMRAKVANRELTEELIVELENESYFSEVNSPLSNLVGKGERFVNMDLILDSEKIITDYSDLKKQTKESTVEMESKPKIRTHIEGSEPVESTEGDEQVEAIESTENTEE